ncbi:hypothetical protein [Dyadobacter fermentans]|uniref:hypothetical protein n=1 Tax=Dyadobacter fermentans TaxID=94254 RepID=UPI0005A0B9BE|nr:hypothetical protein [Dyadobacter fermentans]
MKTIHWKIIAALLVVILVLSVILWRRGFRQPTPNPEAKSFADSVRESKRRADSLADTTQKRDKDYETKLDRYNSPIDTTERGKLGAGIKANAIRKADSLRKRAP